MSAKKTWIHPISFTSNQNSTKPKLSSPSPPLKPLQRCNEVLSTSCEVLSTSASIDFSGLLAAGHKTVPVNKALWRLPCVFPQSVAVRQIRASAGRFCGGLWWFDYKWPHQFIMSVCYSDTPWYFSQSAESQRMGEKCFFLSVNRPGTVVLAGAH